jgi:thymidine kinase
MAQLVFFTGTMDSGKSTLAMQIDYNFARNGRRGLVFTSHDRGGAARITSRIGLESPAIEVKPDFDFYDFVTAELAKSPVAYLVCDEAQFYTPAQIDQLARIVDDLNVEVFAFGITTDFRTSLFPGSARLIELADRVEWLQLQTLCWCGARATHNARVINGALVMEGEQLMLGDTDAAALSYVVLCRRHHMRREVAPS